MIILIQLIMHLNPYLGRPLLCQTHILLFGIIGFQIVKDPINVVLNGRFVILEHIAETWGQSAVLVTFVCITIILITSTSVRIDEKA